MYGLLLESITAYIKAKYGEEAWEEIRKEAEVEYHTFVTHRRYSEEFIFDIAQAAQMVTSTPVEELMQAFGVEFVSFVGQYGYDRILRVLGRNMRDFLNGLDNLHEYLRFSYPKLKPPSFICDNETETGLTLHYRTRRKGFTYYVIGQLKQVGSMFYNIELDIEVLSQQEKGTLQHVIYRLSFANSAFKISTTETDASQIVLPVRSDLFFDAFPFHIVFNSDFVIRSAGSSLLAVLPDCVGNNLKEIFKLTKPMVDFSWETVSVNKNYN